MLVEKNNQMLRLLSTDQREGCDYKCHLRTQNLWVNSEKVASSVLFFRQVLEGPDAPSEEALRGGSGAAAGEAHAGLPQLQVPTTPEEAAEAHLQAGGPRLPPGGPGPGSERPPRPADPVPPTGQRRGLPGRRGRQDFQRQPRPPQRAKLPGPGRLQQQL